MTVVVFMELLMLEYQQSPRAGVTLSTLDLMNIVFELEQLRAVQKK